MTQIVRLLGRFMNAAEESVDIVCRVATSAVPPPHREVGAGGDVQTSIFPTAIMLWNVEAESLEKLRRGTWTHLLWSGEADMPSRERPISQVIIEGENVRVIV